MKCELIEKKKFIGSFEDEIKWLSWPNKEYSI